MPYGFGRTRSGRVYQMPPSPRIGGRGITGGGLDYRQATRLVYPAIAATLGQMAYSRIGSYFNSARSSSSAAGQLPVGSSATKTMRKRKRNQGAGSMMLSKSAGRLTTRRGRSKKDRLYANGGDSHTFEKNGTIDRLDLVIIGHHTSPTVQVRSILGKQLVHQLFRKANVPFTAWTDLLPVGILFNIGYKEPGQGLAFLGFTTVAGNTYQTLVDWFINPARPWNEITSVEVTLAQLQPPTVYLRDAPSATFINLIQMQVHLNIKSNMKIQNRSINSAGNDQVDDVDNCPVHGKSFLFNGNVIRSNMYTLGPLASASEVDGFITSTFVDEPPPMSSFNNAVKQGKIKLDPGEIKTSSLSITHKGKFPELYRKFSQQVDVLATDDNINRFGKMRVFAVEKMINTSPALNISVAYEIDTKLTVHSSLRNSWPTLNTLQKI